MGGRSCWTESSSAGSSRVSAACGVFSPLGPQPPAHFRRMGGAACYPMYSGIDPVVYIGWQLAGELQKQGALEARPRSEPNERLEGAAASFLPRVRELLSEVEVSGAGEAAVLLVAHVEHFSSKLGDEYNRQPDWLALKAFTYEEAYYAIGPDRPDVPR